MNKGLWTKNEIKILKNLYPLGELDEICKLTGRTKCAVLSKRKQFKLTIKPKITEYHLDIPLEKKVYMAGHFDGEGCIRFRKKGKVFSPTLVVSICSLETLLLYKKFFNGSIRTIPNPNGNKQMYRWFTNSFEDIYSFCKAILPYSIEKKKQLDTAIRHIESWIKMGNPRHPTAEFRKQSLNNANECRNLKSI